jgi:MoaA/NifB/PqqE/SkfB family radical SAM enzyme
MNASDTLRLCKFFALLAVKQYAVPSLHVRPLVAELFLTENCNLRCVSCACWHQTKTDELNTHEWKEVLSQLAKIAIYKVNFTGGEPLVRRDTVELMNFARRAGIRHMHLNTNAILLTPSKLDDILESGVRSFNVSVDGPRETHDKIRGRRGAFSQTTSHLRNIVDRRERYGLKIRMNFTVMRDNAATLPEIAKLAQQLGVQLYLNLATDKTFLFNSPAVTEQTRLRGGEFVSALQKMERIARTDSSWLPRFSDLRYVSQHFSDVASKNLPCAESQLKLMIHSRGEIGGCWGHSARYNVREHPINDVIAGAHYRSEHAQFFRKECVGCGSNYSLNLRWRPITYFRDALWRLGLIKLARSGPDAI